MDPEINMECYNTVAPPRVPLENIIQSDMYLFSAQNDLMADPKDVDKLKAALKGMKESCFLRKGRSKFNLFFISEILLQNRWNM